MSSLFTGYGNTAPRTLAGRMFLIVYATIGIPLMGLMLATFGDRLKHVLRACVISFEKKILKRNEPRNIHRKSLIAVFVATAVCLIIMSAISAKMENWDFSVAFYAWFVTLTTIGYGDYIPDGGATKNQTYMVLGGIYTAIALFLSLTLVACILHAISDWVGSATPPSKKRSQKMSGSPDRGLKHREAEPVTITKVLPRSDANFM